MRELQHLQVDALVLDLMLPDGDGLDFCRQLRAETRFRKLPVLMLSARGEPLDRIIGLEVGADDYLAKPFSSPARLLARGASLLRQQASGVQRLRTLRFGRLRDRHGRAHRPHRRQAVRPHRPPVRAAARAGSEPGRVLSRDQIMDQLKGHPWEAFDRSIDVAHLAHPCGHPRDDPKAPRRILTVRGAGYVLARKQDGEEGGEAAA